MANTFDSRQTIYRGNLARLASGTTPALNTLLGSINSEITPSLGFSVTGANTTVTLGASVITNAVTGVSHTLPTIGSNTPNLAASTIVFTWVASVITATPSLGLASTATLSNNNYIKGLVYVDGNDQINVLFGTEAASIAAADVVATPSGVIAAGYILLHVTGSALVNIATSDLFQFGSGGGSGGGGSGSVLDPDQESTYAFYARSDFSVDKKLFFGSVSGAGVTDQVLGLSRIKSTAGTAIFTSNNLVGNQLRYENLRINQASIRLLYENRYTEPAVSTPLANYPIIKISRDGGTTFVDVVESSISAKGNMVIADYAFPTDDVLSGGTISTIQTGINGVAAVITPVYDQVLSSFDFYLSTAAVSGTVTAYLHAYSGTIGSQILSSAITKVLGTDITSTPGYTNFTFSTPYTLMAGVSYAIVVRNSVAGANTDLVGYTTTSSAAWNTSGITWNGTTGNIYTNNALKYAMKLYSSGVDMRIKVQSSGVYTGNTAAESHLSGFGVDFVWQGNFPVIGDAKSETRIVTSTEASTGLFTLQGVTFTPGMKQVSAYSAGHSFIAPQFTELSSNQIQFPAASFITGDVVTFVANFGMVDGSSVALSKLNLIYDAIVGSAGQVAAGQANYSSIQSAHDALSAGSSIFVLNGTYTGNISISKEINIVGKGRSSVVSGTFTMTNTADFSKIENLKITGTITFNAGADSIFFQKVYQSTGGVLTNSGSANAILVIVE